MSNLITVYFQKGDSIQSTQINPEHVVELRGNVCTLVTGRELMLNEVSADAVRKAMGAKAPKAEEPVVHTGPGESAPGKKRGGGRKKAA